MLVLKRAIHDTRQSKAGVEIEAQGCKNSPCSQVLYTRWKACAYAGGDRDLPQRTVCLEFRRNSLDAVLIRPGVF